ncbi:protein kinase IME2 KNAG_0B01670 [Huiozyma naganishii CBS 8797]|uniref:Protein kinase domain-containing protein n=1 Tax=Huiozyma naganishii (strain ATCC MYA-139 / BCRC 22969 / CBS 8797 / KCTC 17520 / NBRC 10181 / NCYC 3082 / Yp74L-3) TaxID=1071383 RepID=J7RUS7_HUIN7|nr:hypothetical protein KNAG_0B01670 [Kazachstania naganishii CBS 8797]CCK68612.1 hypothetical protein KNAG_0B01670 [Kazachstania naganishii CBS 8797]
MITAEFQNTGDTLGVKDRFVPSDVDNPPSNIPLHSLENRYFMIKELGNGSFGTVSLSKALVDLDSLPQKKTYDRTLLHQRNKKNDNHMSKMQNIVAIKTMLARLDTLHYYKRVREVKFILKMPSSKYLIQIFEIFVDDIEFQLHIVMEYMEQNLYQMMRHRRRRVFSYPSLKSILAQILAGIKHIHRHNFFHRDIKPENILISPSSIYFDKSVVENGEYTDNYVVKLADFGLAREVSNKNTYTAYVSTRWYRSPEILLRNGYYSRPLDIWAFGCVALEATTFKPLFPGSDELDQIWKILEVLGTPHPVLESTQTHYIPNGGFWEDSVKLAERLKLRFPYVEGVSIKAILSNPQLSDLTKMIECCLKWDPNKRATAEDLSRMKFFEGTVVQEDSTLLYNNSMGITNTEQAMIFAGIPANGDSYTNKPLIFTESSNKIGIVNNCNENSATENYTFGNRNNAAIKKTVLEDKSSMYKPMEQKVTINEFLNDYNGDIKGHGNVHSAENTLRVNEIEMEENEFIEDTNDDADTSSSYQAECDLSNEIERSLDFFPIPKEVPESINQAGSTTYENDPHACNVKKLSENIDVVNRDDSAFFEQCFYETPELMGDGFFDTGRERKDYTCNTGPTGGQRHISESDQEMMEYPLSANQGITEGNGVNDEASRDNYHYYHTPCGSHLDHHHQCGDTKQAGSATNYDKVHSSIDSIHDFTPRIFLPPNVQCTVPTHGSSIFQREQVQQGYNNKMNRSQDISQYFSNVTF